MRVFEKEISHGAPIGVLKGIKPLCVPFAAGSPLADEVMSRRNPRLVSLWERLGLVYFIEQPMSEPAVNTNITLNNFTAQVIFRAYCQNYTERLAERYQSDFAYSDTIRQLLTQHDSSRIIRNALKINARYAEESSRVFSLLFEKQPQQAEFDTICLVLDRLIKSAGEKRIFTAKHEMLFKRIAQVLSVERPASRLMRELAKAGAAENLTLSQLRYIRSLSAAVTKRSRIDAAERVVELAIGDNHPEKIRDILAKEAGGYGIVREFIAAKERGTAVNAAGYISRSEAADKPRVLAGKVIGFTAGAVQQTLMELAAQPSADNAPQSEYELIVQHSAEKVLLNTLNAYRARERYGRITEQRAPDGAAVQLINSENNAHNTHNAANAYNSYNAQNVQNTTNANNSYNAHNVQNATNAYNSYNAHNVQNTANAYNSYNTQNVQSTNTHSEYKLNSQSIFNEQGKPNAPAQREVQTYAQMRAYNALKVLREYFSQEIIRDKTLSPAEHIQHNHFASVTAAGAVRILRQYNDSRQWLLLPPQSVDISREVVTTLEIMEHFSANTAREMQSEEPAELAGFRDIISPAQTAESISAVDMAGAAEVAGNIAAADGVGSIAANSTVFSEQLFQSSNTANYNAALLDKADGYSAQQSAEQIHAEHLTERILSEKLSAEQLSAEQQLSEQTSVERQSTERILFERLLTEREKTLEKIAEHSEKELVEKIAGNAAGAVVESEIEKQIERAAEQLSRGEVIPADADKPQQSAEQIHAEHLTERILSEQQSAEKLISEQASVERQSTERILSEQRLTERELIKAREQSYRSKLDQKTLEVLDSIVATAKLEEKLADIPLVHAQSAVVQEANEQQASISEEIRTLNIINSSIASKPAAHFRALTQIAQSAQRAQSAALPTATVKPFSQSTLVKSDMVMLNPVIRTESAGDYRTQPAAIELKQPQTAQPERAELSATKTVQNNRAAVLKPLEGRVDSLSREEISKLADKVYERIEQTLSRERRRMGL